MNDGFLWWSDFLSDDLVEMVRTTMRDKRANFTPSTTNGTIADYRRSHVLWDCNYPELRTKFIDRLTSLFDNIQDGLDIFKMAEPIGSVELQLTTSNDGDFFKHHNDSGHPECASRKITFVYYFSMTDEPGFTGGNLLLHTLTDSHIITPTHNTVIIFPSYFYHEVQPVVCASQDFYDGRHTLNGWIRA